MVILLLGLFIISSWKLRFAPFHDDYLELSTTTAIKGIFAVIIFYSHLRGYISLPDSIGNRVFLLFLNFLGQAMVAMYLFYSGFGIYESVKKKPSYMDYFFRGRICKTLVNFDLAVIMFLLAGWAMGFKYPISYYTTCWIGWDSVGNSNWFIFDILSLYLGVFIFFRLSQVFIHMRNERLFLYLVTLFTIGLWVVLFFTKRESFWVNTLMAFPLGIWYSYFKGYIDIVMKKAKYYYPIFIALTIILLIWRQTLGIDNFGGFTCCFALWIVLLSMKIKYNNGILQKLGLLAFPIYIIQRLPMNILSYFRIDGNIPLFVCMSTGFTLVLAIIFNKLIFHVDYILFNNTKK